MAAQTWAECYTIYREKLGSADYSALWRIDTDADGPYISLRLYDSYDKKDEQEKKEHLETYEKMKAAAKAAVGALKCPDMTWESVDPGNKGRYYEADVLHVKLDDYLYSGTMDDLIKHVHNLDRLFHAYYDC